MGWEKRGNKFYYYDKKKINGKIVSIYCGQQVPHRIEIKKNLQSFFKKLKSLDNLFSLTKEQAVDLLSSLPSYNLDLINNLFCQIIKENKTELIKNFLSFPIIDDLKLINLYHFFSINQKYIKDFRVIAKFIKLEENLVKKLDKACKP